MTSLHTINQTAGRRNEEEQLQRSIVALLEVAADPKIIWTAVNPGGDRKSKATAGRHKAMGLKPGVADLMFVLKGGEAAFLELKAGKGKQSPSQVSFQRQCIVTGVPYAIATDMDQAIAVLNGWRVFKTEVRG